ncbi:MAG: hypothetical protein WD595_03535 [Waddliaceae bacterium]
MRTLLVIRDGVKLSKSKTFVVSKKTYMLHADKVKLAKSHRDLIEHHVATRVALFFQQAIACYRTPFHFEIGDTEGQIFEAKKLMMKTEDGEVKEGEEEKEDIEIKENPNAKYSKTIETGYQAAHSSTIPSLKACPNDEYKDAIAKKKKPKYYSFLQGSHIDTLNNSTVGLPTFVNQVDTLIDGNSKCKNALRIDTINLINKLAKGKITPCEATREFLDCFLHQLETRPKVSKNLTSEKRETIRIYKEKVKELIELAEKPEDLKKGNTFFDYLLSNNFSKANQKDLPVIRKIFYQRKFEIIRESQFTDTKIQNIINERFKKAIKPADRHVIRACLTLQTANNTILNKTLQSLFCISIEAMKEDKAWCKELQERYKADKKNYDNTLRDIREVVRSYQKMEQAFQALLLRDFRTKLRGLTQKELADKLDSQVKKEIKEEKAKETPNTTKIHLLSDTPRSASTISRLENSRIHIQNDFKTGENQRRKELIFRQAELISKALGVDPAYFFCSFFASKRVEK